MGIIRGKIWHDVDWCPNKVTLGDWPTWLQQDKEGHWFDNRTGERVKTQSLREFLEEYGTHTKQQCSECDGDE